MLIIYEKLYGAMGKSILNMKLPTPSKSGYYFMVYLFLWPEGVVLKSEKKIKTDR